MDQTTGRCESVTNCYLNDISSVYPETLNIMKRSLFCLISIFLFYLKFRPEPVNQYLLDKFSGELKRINQVCSSDRTLRNLTLDLDAFSFGLYYTYMLYVDSVRSEEIFRTEEQTPTLPYCQARHNDVDQYFCQFVYKVINIGLKPTKISVLIVKYRNKQLNGTQRMLNKLNARSLTDESKLEIIKAESRTRTYSAFFVCRNPVEKIVSVYNYLIQAWI